MPWKLKRKTNKPRGHKGNQMSKAKKQNVTGINEAPASTDINEVLDAAEANDATELGGIGNEAETGEFVPEMSQAASDAFAEYEAAEEKASLIFNFYTNEINIDHALNGRRKRRLPTDKDIIAMAADITANGILEPAMGFFETGTNFAYLVFGYGRSVALELANSTRADDNQILLPVIFNPNIHTKEDALALNVSENVMRKELTVLDIADDMHRFKSMGLQNVDIATKFGMVKSSVTGYLSLLKLPMWIQDQIANGTFTLRTGLELVAVMKDEKDKEAGLKKVEAMAHKLIEKTREQEKPKVSANQGREAAVEAGSTRTPVAAMTLKGLKDIIDSSTGAGEDARVQVVNLVVSALISGASEKEYGIGKVNGNTFTKKLVTALDQVSAVTVVAEVEEEEVEPVKVAPVKAKGKKAA
jgi:hypothetical protein